MITQAQLVTLARKHKKLDSRIILHELGWDKIESSLRMASKLQKLGIFVRISRGVYKCTLSAKAERVKETINTAIRSGNAVIISGTKLNGKTYSNRKIFPEEIKVGANGTMSVLVKDSNSTGFKTFLINKITKIQIYYGKKLVKRSSK